MKWVMLGSLIMLFAIGWLQEASAQSSCNLLSGDDRRFCLARANHSPTECYSIGDADRKRLCIAESTGSYTQCGSISDQRGRNYCRGVTGR